MIVGDVLEVNVLTISCCHTKQALKPSARINKLHERTHIGLASDTPNWSQSTKIYNRRWIFLIHLPSHWTYNQTEWHCCLFHNILNNKICISLKFKYTTIILMRILHKWINSWRDLIIVKSFSVTLMEFYFIFLILLKEILY